MQFYFAIAHVTKKSLYQSGDYSLAGDQQWFLGASELSWGFFCYESEIFFSQKNHWNFFGFEIGSPFWSSHCIKKNQVYPVNNEEYTIQIEQLWDVLKRWWWHCRLHRRLHRCVILCASNLYTTLNVTPEMLD